MTKITDGMLKFKPIIKKPIMASHKFFAAVTFSRINSFPSAIQTYLLKANFHRFRKDFHQDNPPFLCLQFYKHNCLDIHATNICFCTQVKNQ